ncbi:MAG: hypothetical protein IT276_06465 [Ignavibacteriaceae bacterium]|nr:hypothetical protein [Ignavibacterium sp.]MCC6254536.1 hypothetical protein [Ignavibacteriaceae bacterium]HRP92643.1 hypothetical protein [Ignavibacteriaceae bacterium]HRQ55562.1 hypothetical protein [Ignavibacteriaceae bacterium]
MIIINDEILNKYFDDDLSSDEKLIVKTAIKNSTELQKKYDLLLKINSLLKSMNPDSPSLDFTKLAMNKINSKTSIARQQKYFLLAILSFLVLIALGITGYLLFQILSSTRSSETNEVVSTYTKRIGDYLSNIFGKQNLSIFGSILSFVMLVSAYFLYELKKQSKKIFSH